MKIKNGVGRIAYGYMGFSLDEVVEIKGELQGVGNALLSWTVEKEKSKRATVDLLEKENKNNKIKVIE